MKIKRVVLTEEPYPVCAVSGKQLGYFAAVFEVERDDETTVYVDSNSFVELSKHIKTIT